MMWMFGRDSRSRNERSNDGRTVARRRRWSVPCAALAGAVLVAGTALGGVVTGQVTAQGAAGDDAGVSADRARPDGGTAGATGRTGSAAGLAAEAAPVTGAVFNDPTGTSAEQYRIRDHVLGLIEATEPGATISMSIYNITDHERGVADAIIAAAERGVAVRVVLESTNADTGSAQALVSALGTDQSKPSWAKVCIEGCMGSKINHNKFYLFSEVAGATDVVVQASANLTISNARNYWNNAVTIVGNSALYQGYLDYFEDLARDRQDLDYYRTVSAGDVKAYHFPRAGSDSSTDTVYNTLGNVDCAGGTTLKIAMWYFGREAIARRLADLAEDGCRVDIAYTEMLDGPRAALQGTPNVRMRQLDDGTYVIHSKYLIIDGSYADVDRRVVFTGSPNYSNAALRTNDETMLRIYSDAIYEQYAANFADVFAAAG